MLQMSSIGGGVSGYNDDAIEGGFGGVMYKRGNRGIQKESD